VVKLKKTFTFLLGWLLLATNFVMPSAEAAECTPEVTTNGALTVVAFKAVGTCTWTTPTATTTFRGLIIGGGGAGGAQMGGGGGGGGMVEFDSLTATNDEFTIVVGNGGAGSSSRTTVGNTGENSSISGNSISLIARGGAGGKTDASSIGAYASQSNRGSGGGGGTTDGSSLGTQTSQSQTPLLNTINGNQYGTDGSTGQAQRSGGGGGASAAGGATSLGYAGAGGAGRSNNILGTNYTWAGGGGGASSNSNRPGSGGSGGGAGGGAPAGWQVGTAGTGGINTATAGALDGGSAGANTGGGGGGGTTNYGGGSGGSGIVILSYIKTMSQVSMSLQLSTGLLSATYRINSTIEALVPAAGRVTFYAAGKAISGCARKVTTGTSPNIKATCTWRPSSRGSVALSAMYTPTNVNFSSSRVDYFPVTVTSRGSRR
jgi:hypothetical protein